MMTDIPSRLLFNDGHGAFQDSGPTLARGLHGAAVGDVDGDGDPDLVFSSNRADRPPSPVYLNQGGGHFSASLSNLDGGGSAGVGVYLADVDGDGDLDLFVAAFTSGSNQVWLNRLVEQGG